MLVVKVQLHSAVTGQVSDIACMVISNDGTGDSDIGNYDARIIRKPGRTQSWPDKIGDTLFGNAKPTRVARVLKYARQRRPVWDLVALALKNAGYGK